MRHGGVKEFVCSVVRSSFPTELRQGHSAYSPPWDLQYMDCDVDTPPLHPGPEVAQPYDLCLSRFDICGDHISQLRYQRNMFEQCATQVMPALAMASF